MHLVPAVAVSTFLTLAFAQSAFAQEVGAPPPPPTEEPGAPSLSPETPAEPLQPAAPTMAPAIEEATAPAAAEAPMDDGYGSAAAPAPTSDYGDAASDEEAKTGLKVTGSFFTRYELREGYDDIGRTHPRYRESDFVFYRARFGITTTPIDIGKGKHVVLKFEPQASGFWADKSGTLSDGDLGLHQATLRISGDSYWVDAGRFEMAYGEHLVIGNVGWHQTGRSFDGIRSRIKLDKGWVDVFATQVLEDPFKVKPYGAGDKYFGGIYAGLGPMVGEDVDLDAYLLTQVTPRVSVDTELGLQLTAGSRFKKKFGASDVRAEAGVQVATGSIDQLAYHGEAEFGTKVAKTRLAALGWFASGDDPTTAKNEGWDQLYPTAHKFMGLADIMGGRSNIAGGAARVRHKVSDLGLGADANVYVRPQTASGVDAYSGVEIDSWALQSLGKGLGLRGGYSLFIPNESGEFGTSDVAHYVEVQLAFALK